MKVPAPLVCPVCLSDTAGEERREALGWCESLAYAVMLATDGHPQEALNIVAKYSRSDTGKFNEAMSE